MVADAIIAEHFGRSDVASLSTAEYERGVASLLAAIANEEQEERRLALWLAARRLGFAPPAQRTFSDAAIRARAASIEDAEY
jgi:cobalamin biosynthesis protein CbiG